MKKTNIFGLVLILSTLLIGCAQPNMCADIPEVYTITKNSPEHGTVELSKTSAMVGETITVTATPAEHYQVSEIKVNDSPIDGTSFTMPASNVNVEVNFAQITYNITAIVPTGITVNKHNAAFGEEVTVTLGGNFQSIIPSTGGVIVKKGNQVITVTNNKFTMPEGNVEITVSLNSNTPIGYFIDSELSCYEIPGDIVLETFSYGTYKDFYKKSIYVSGDGNGYYTTISADCIEYIPNNIIYDANNNKIKVYVIEKGNE